MITLAFMADDKCFNVNEYVVYPLHGVGLIKEIYSREVAGIKQVCYRIQLQESDLTISIPKEKAITMGLRSIIQKTEIKHVIASLEKKPSFTEDNWKLRFQCNIEKLKTGNIHHLINVIKELFLRNKVKALSIMERKQYENAYRMLIKELSISGDTNEEEIKSIVADKLDALALTLQPS